MSESDDVVKATLAGTNSKACDPTPEQLKFILSKISESYEDAVKRVNEIRREAYEHFPYPCVRHFTFLKLAMAAHPAYPTVIAAGKGGNTLLLDLGCCMGTDVRKAAHDGYPEENLVGSDLHEEYLRLGYKLYDDESTCKINFFAADIFDLDLEENTNAVDSPLESKAIANLHDIMGRVTHVYAGLLFHLFEEDTQAQLARRLAILLKKTPGSIIFGRHEGRDEPGFINAEKDRPRFGHSPESWEKVWREVFTILEGEEFARDRLRFWTKLYASKTPMPDFPNSKWLFWSIKII
ncbi:hypothetical protein SCHPADRAFT_904223 [Schizopora paradoxa]|uniref:Uncharacterized protein n=1 Tax=Schizopora paradoxa TaxID=27342 RepID=A0A0H2RNA9_9AGAM|nr:hypothetical protein SCHPADRAFT_904223 [Schizopora paradoxa]